MLLTESFMNLVEAAYATRSELLSYPHFHEKKGDPLYNEHREVGYQEHRWNMSKGSQTGTF